MQTLEQAITRLVQRDPGHRGLLGVSLPAPDPALAARMLSAERVLILTGFPILLEAGGFSGETDGPPGAADVAAAFTKLGRRVAVATDPVSRPLVSAALAVRAPAAELVVVSEGGESAAAAVLDAFCPDLLIAIERPGRGNDGHYHSMRGVVLDSMLVETDSLYALAKSRGVYTVSVGDGGNELGQGNHRALVEASLENGAAIVSSATADCALLAGVSNWWGFGLAALLSAASTTMLLPTDEEETRLLTAVVEAGGADGVLHRTSLSVDGIPLAENLALLAEIRALTERAIAAREDTPAAFRRRIREGAFTGPTAGYCPGFAQCNLVVLPRKYADDFLLFTQRNPKPCPVLEVTRPGARLLCDIAPGADIATDLPRYRVYENGELTGEYTDVSALWRDDFVSFLIGCSFSFESALLSANVPVRHIEEGRNVPMFTTNVPCQSAGVFSGNLVVSMRPLPPDRVQDAIDVTAACPRVHGAPVQVGDPAAIGILDVHRPDFGDAVTIHPGEIPVFWACGVTPQAVVMHSKLPFVITHAPGHMLVTDVTNAALMQPDCSE